MEPSGVSLFPNPSIRRARLGVRSLAVAVVVVLVAACQTQAASNPPATSGPPSAGPATGQPTVAPSTGASTGLRGLFHVVGSEPIIPRSMFDDRGAVLPGAIAVDSEGGYHAWIIAFGEAPGTQEIHYVTSDDADSWTEVEDASLEGLSDGFGNPGAMPTSVLEDGDGWVMYLVGTLATEQQGWDIWRATARKASGPWTRSDEPVLRRGKAGTWDAGAVDFPTVVATEDGYTMVYSGTETAASSTGSVGVATSEDGIAWTKRETPVAEPGLCGGFDDRAIHQPRVVVLDDGWVMAYAGYAGSLDSRASIGFADSRDSGVTWGCEWPANALSVEELPAGDGVHTVNAFLRGDRIALLVEWLADGGSDVWLAHLGPRQP